MNKIIWEKFKDPLASFAKKNEEDDEDTGRAIVTKNGIMPVIHENMVSTNYNLWIGYTNFVITTDMVDTLEHLIGVESLDVFSPYRFRLGIAKKFFKEEEIKVNVEYTLNCQTNSLEILEEDKKNEILELETRLKEDGRPYVIYTLPNAEVSSFVGDTEQVNEKMKFFEEVQNIVGGYILSGP